MRIKNLLIITTALVAFTTVAHAKDSKFSLGSSLNNQVQVSSQLIVSADKITDIKNVNKKRRVKR